MTTSFEQITAGMASLDIEQAAEIARDVFGVDVASVEPLDGESDRNFLMTDARGVRTVLKIASSSTPLVELELQNAVIDHLSTAAGHEIGSLTPNFVPSVVNAVGGEAIGEVVLGSGTHPVRMLTWVEGTPIREVAYRDERLLREVGRTAGLIVNALEGFDHPGAERSHHWDVRRIPEAVAECAPFVADPADREVVERVVSWIDAGAFASLPTSVLHQDLNDHNIIVDDVRGRHSVCGVLDFGDTLRTIRVGELAVAMAYAMRDEIDPLAAAASVARGYAEVASLTEDEARVVFPLAAGRLCVNATTWARRSADEPDNTYAVDRIRGSWTCLRTLAELDPAYCTAVVAAALGHAPRPAPIATTFAPVIQEQLRVIDIGGDGDVHDVEQPNLSGCVAPFGNVDLFRAGHRVTDTVLLGSRAYVETGTTVTAPVAGTVERTGDDWLVLRHDDAFTCFAGLAPSATGAIAQGQPIGATTGPLFVQVARSLPATGRPPEYAGAEQRDAIAAVFDDPAALLGVEPLPAAPRRVEEIVATRDVRFAKSQKSYYVRPMNIVRARGVWMYDEDGRSYLDAVNNVTHVGHGHPHIVEAVHRQMHRLNTNSRFVYSQLADYAERLASKFPAPLEVVFFACTGSEANDLAVRIARTVTGNDTIITIDGAYHGNTTAVTAVSPNRYKMIGGEAPPTTCEVPQPNRYRGEYGYDDPDAGVKYAAQASDRIANFVAQHAPPAAVIAESMMGTAGEIVHPDGYLKGLFDATRRSGGLAICDEVQVGFGRMGETFWGFQMHDVVPDIVTLGKPIGNGYPLSAVVTTRDIADAFDNGMRYFNTFGGNPVACAAGMAVLDVVEQEGLQERAKDVGAYMLSRLNELRAHDVVGDVRGQGMYFGVELVRDRETKEFARDEAFAISERMKNEGVIVYPNGAEDNILKFKPPMVFGREHADIVADTLDEVLRTGW